MESLPADNGGPRAPTLAEDPALGLSHRAKIEILGAVMLALFLGALDQTIVGTALPRIVTDLGGNEYYTWVVTIYLLTSTITVPFYGKLRPVRPQADADDRRDHLPRRLGALRPVAEHGHADPLPGHPGRRRRGVVPDRTRRHR